MEINLLDMYRYINNKYGLNIETYEKDNFFIDIDSIDKNGLYFLRIYVELVDILGNPDKTREPKKIFELAYKDIVDDYFNKIAWFSLSILETLFYDFSKENLEKTISLYVDLSHPNRYFVKDLISIQK